MSFSCRSLTEHPDVKPWIGFIPTFADESPLYRRRFFFVTAVCYTVAMHRNTRALFLIVLAATTAVSAAQAAEPPKPAVLAAKVTKVNDGDSLVARPDFALRREWAAVLERYSGLRSFSDRVADLDDWGVETVRRLLSSVPPPAPFAQLPDPYER